MTHSNKLSRRDVLRAVGVGLGAAATGCAANTGGGGRGGDAVPIGDPAKFDGEVTCGPAATDWRQARSRISQVVVLCMENRSFDHYFGAMSLPRELGGLGLSGIAGLTGSESNLDRSGREIRVHRAEDFSPHDLPHDWDPVRVQLAGRTNGGFVQAAEAHAFENTDKLQKKIPREQRLDAEALAAVMAGEAMGYHTPDQLPMFYELARQSTLCTHWYSSVLGPTWTNRFFLHGATALGLHDNMALDAPLERLRMIRDRLFGWQSVLDVLEADNGITATNFYHDVSWLRAVNPSVGRELKKQYAPMTSRLDSVWPRGFFARAAANKLPQFSIVDPHFGTFHGRDANDDHPDPGGSDDHDIRKGQALIATVVAALAENPDTWNRTLLVITYDEHGGFYDHIVPPETDDSRPDFRQLGFRVPSVVVGPYVRRGCAVTSELDHTAILNSVERLFGIERGFGDRAVRQRLDAGGDLLECLDADALEGRPHPAPELPPVPMSIRKWRDLPHSETFHQELRWAALTLPREIQDEARDPYILERVLARGEALGAVVAV